MCLSDFTSVNPQGRERRRKEELRVAGFGAFSAGAILKCRNPATLEGLVGPGRCVISEKTTSVCADVLAVHAPSFLFLRPALSRMDRRKRKEKREINLKFKSNFYRKARVEEGRIERKFKAFLPRQKKDPTFD